MQMRLLLIVFSTITCIAIPVAVADDESDHVVIVDIPVTESTGRSGDHIVPGLMDYTVLLIRHCVLMEIYLVLHLTWLSKE